MREKEKEQVRLIVKLLNILRNAKGEPLLDEKMNFGIRRKKYRINRKSRSAKRLIQKDFMDFTPSL